jgi:hypothetical protein
MGIANPPNLGSADKIRLPPAFGGWVLWASVCFFAEGEKANGFANVTCLALPAEPALPAFGGFGGQGGSVSHACPVLIMAGLVAWPPNPPKAGKAANGRLLARRTRRRRARRVCIEWPSANTRPTPATVSNPPKAGVPSLEGYARGVRRAFYAGHNCIVWLQANISEVKASSWPLKAASNQEHASKVISLGILHFYIYNVR